MSQKGVDRNLKSALDKLDKSAQEIVRTRGYTHEVEKVRVLEEIIKEQLKYENFSSAARKTR